MIWNLLCLWGRFHVTIIILQMDWNHSLVNADSIIWSNLFFFSNFCCVLDVQIHISFTHVWPVGWAWVRVSMIAAQAAYKAGQVCESLGQMLGVCETLEKLQTRIQDDTKCSMHLHILGSFGWWKITPFHHSVKYPAWSGRRDTWTLLCLGTYAQLFSWTYIAKRMKHQQCGGLNPWSCSWWCWVIMKGCPEIPCNFTLPTEE